MCSCAQQARNAGDTPLVTTTEVTIVLLDENDVTPFFPTSPEVVTVTEGAAIDTMVRLEMEGCAYRGSTVLHIVVLLKMSCYSSITVCQYWDNWLIY